MAQVQDVFLALAAHLAEKNYVFVCPSPEAQKRVVQARTRDPNTRHSRSLEDLFGWSLPANEDTLNSLLPAPLLERLQEADVITKTENGISKANFRLSNFDLPHTGLKRQTAEKLYYIHSAFPTSDDGVFFGPDTYLFLDYLRRALEYAGDPALDGTLVDVCCGSGGGAIRLAQTFPKAKVIGIDLNQKAIDLAPINAALAKCPQINFAQSDLYEAVKGQDKKISIIVSNPPYIASSKKGDVPVYADGGANQGLSLPMRIVEEGIPLLSKGGLFIMYTGVPISSKEPGHDPFLDGLQAIGDTELLEYTIIVPDMWAEELGTGAYVDVGRIQVVGAVLRKTS